VGMPHTERLESRGNEARENFSEIYGERHYRNLGGGLCAEGLVERQGMGWRAPK